MSIHQVVTYVFLALTSLFALSLWIMLFVQAVIVGLPHQRAGVEASKSLLGAMSLTGDATQTINASADAVQKILDALGAFGKDINTLRPLAVAAVFAAFFALLTVVLALVP